MEPLIVHGTTASYFTGKLEAYLRAKGIAYRLEPFTRSSMRRCAANTGVMQIPQVECVDGGWLVDSSLIIEHFEALLPEPGITPTNPVLAFVSRLVEDYADEWLWRPAMHYRWSYPETAALLSAWLAEHLAAEPGPVWVKRLWWRTRQFGTFVKGDGVNAQNRSAVEATYLDTLTHLESLFAQHPFVLGQRPTEADFGLFGPMFRHFFSDPAPARIMRERAPGVQEWVARMWNLKPESFAGAAQPASIPEELGGLLADVSEHYLPYLDTNAEAFADGLKTVSYTAGGARFTEPVKPYRVWCRDQLQARLVALSEAQRAELATLLTPEKLASLLQPSPKPARNAVGSLPIRPQKKTRPIDSWWR